ASLSGAVLHGAQLDQADLQGALLKGTQLHGVVFADLPLHGAMLDRVYAWRAPSPASGARVIAPETGPKHSQPGCRGSRAGVHCEWTTKEFDDLKRLIETRVPEGALREKALQQVASLDPAKEVADEKKMAATWVDLARSPPNSEAYEKALRDVGCDEKG